MPPFPLDVHALPEEMMAQKKGIICTGEGEGRKTGGNRREFEVKWSSYVWPLTGVFLQRPDYILFCTGAPALLFTGSSVF